ncbi:MAG: hypothetical protein LBC72_03195 [Spirochaetaceae bacterium]|nr:hypothetical protein [Spirochaetaceae bacterium]
MFVIYQIPGAYVEAFCQISDFRFQISGLAPAYQSKTDALVCAELSPKTRPPPPDNRQPTTDNRQPTTDN